MSTIYEFLLTLEKRGVTHYKALEKTLPRIHSSLPFLFEWGLTGKWIEECEAPKPKPRGRGWFHRDRQKREKPGRPPQRYYKVTEKGNSFLNFMRAIWNKNKKLEIYSVSHVEYTFRELSALYCAFWEQAIKKVMERFGSES